VPFCADAQASAGTCGAESRVGTVTAAAGVGSAPLTITGPVYLAGPGDGALARLAIVLPGKVGPFDFGNLVSFAKLLIRTNDGGLDVVTNNLPTRWRASCTCARSGSRSTGPGSPSTRRRAIRSRSMRRSCRRSARRRPQTRPTRRPVATSWPTTRPSLQ
jgi:hypothetical protein